MRQACLKCKGEQEENVLRVQSGNIKRFLKYKVKLLSLLGVHICVRHDGSTVN